jgi:hypothetical protein
MLARGEGGWASPGYSTSYRDFGTSFKNSKHFCGLRPQSQRGPLPVSGRYAPDGHFTQCLSGPEGEGGVDVASYIQGPARGLVCS